MKELKSLLEYRFRIEIKDLELMELESLKDRRRYIEGKLIVKVQEELTRPWIKVLGTDTE